MIISKTFYLFRRILVEVLLFSYLVNVKSFSWSFLSPKSTLGRTKCSGTGQFLDTASTMTNDKNEDGRFHLQLPLLQSILDGAHLDRALGILERDRDREHQAVRHEKIQQAFWSMVDSSSFLERGGQVTDDPPIQENSETKSELVFFRLSCRAPALGDSVAIYLEPLQQIGAYDINSSDDPLDRQGYVFTVYTNHASDFGWICTKLYECRDLFVDVNFDQVRQVVLRHMEGQQPHPGYPADVAIIPYTMEGVPVWQQILSSQNVLQFQRYGYCLVQDGPLTTIKQHESLSRYLVGTTGQATSVRTDKVHFLSQSDAANCGMEQQFDLLRSLANHLNKNLDISLLLGNSAEEPILPATTFAPLTIPKLIQLAEYGRGDFYRAHSDNSLTDDGNRRRNYRAITCILYCNEGWDAVDGGGELVIYPGSQGYANADEAVQNSLQGLLPPPVKVVPQNGHIVLFDSQLVHSVRPVLSSCKVRRALTIWINRPTQALVEGERYYAS